MFLNALMQMATCETNITCIEQVVLEIYSSDERTSVTSTFSMLKVSIDHSI